MRKQQKRMMLLAMITAFIATGVFLSGLVSAGDWPNPRFTDNGDGTVTDNLTGLIWLRNANCFGERRDWSAALSACNGLASGSCGLTDGSSAGDWRLPSVKELHTLIHWGFSDPAVPNTAGTGKWSEGDPFTGVQSSYYWSRDKYGDSLAYGREAQRVDMGYVGYDDATKPGYVWPVRGGN